MSSKGVPSYSELMLLVWHHHDQIEKLEQSIEELRRTMQEIRTTATGSIQEIRTTATNMDRQITRAVDLVENNNANFHVNLQILQALQASILGMRRDLDEQQLLYNQIDHNNPDRDHLDPDHFHHDLNPVPGAMYR